MTRRARPRGRSYRPAAAGLAIYRPAAAGLAIYRPAAAGLAVLAAAVLAVGVGPAAAATPAPAPEEARPAAPREAGDAMIVAMQVELERSADRLRLPGYEKPYFLAYTVKEQQRLAISGKLGALYRDEREQARMAHVDVRVGDWDFDSSEDDEVAWPYEDEYEPTQTIPLVDDLAAVRHTLWLLTDLRYKQALSSYLKLKGERVYTPERKRKRPSNSKAPLVRRVDDLVALSADAERWRATVRRLGAVVAEDPTIFDSDVSFYATVETRWMVTTEGIRLRTVQPMYELHVTAWARAEDGMLLDKSVDVYGRREDQLPDDETLVARTRAMMADLEALRTAPELDPYTGPAILEPAATGVFFHEVLGHRLEGHRQDREEEGQTFSDHLGKAILPEFLSVYDDPTLRFSGETPLNGNYDVDDEGVVAQRVTLVDRGVLKGFLMGRRPVSGFTASNGHGRAQGVMPPFPRMGNLLVEAHRSIPHEELKARLLEEVRRAGKPFGLIIRDITGGSTNTSSYGYQAFKGEARMVYKVDATTGEETLVRGVDIVGTPLVSLGKILAASRETGVFNGYCGAESGMVPVSTIAPATLFGEIELQRSARGRSKDPVLPPPARPPTSTRSR